MVAPKSDLMHDGQDAADLHPVLRESEDDEIHETDYFDELDSPNPFVFKKFEVEDNNSDQADASSPSPRSSSPTERLFGDVGDYMTLGRDQRRSMTERTDTHSEFESRSPQAMPVKEVSRCRHFQLHRSRVGSLAELSSPPGTPCLTLQEPILFPDLWYSGEQAYRIGQDGGICAIRSRKPFCHLKRWVRTSFFMREL